MIQAWQWEISLLFFNSGASTRLNCVWRTLLCSLALQFRIKQIERVFCVPQTWFPLVFLSALRSALESMCPELEEDLTDVSFSLVEWNSLAGTALLSLYWSESARYSRVCTQIAFAEQVSVLMWRKWDEKIDSSWGHPPADSELLYGFPRKIYAFTWWWST